MRLSMPWLGAVTLSSCMMVSSCVNLAAIEPVSTPPSQFQIDVTTDVEFLAPRSVGQRCVQRGGKVFGMAAFSSMACANTRLITMPDPCAVNFSTRYNETLCETLKANTAVDVSSGAAETKAYRLIRVEFIHPDLIAQRCLERSGSDQTELKEAIQACRNSVMITVTNPCAEGDLGWYANLLCHEMGHANGWPANHARPKGSVSFQRTTLAPKPLALDPKPRLSAQADSVRVARQSDPVRFITRNEVNL